MSVYDPSRCVWACVSAARAVARQVLETPDHLAALAQSTGLSPEGVRLALQHHLELQPSSQDIASLVRSVRPATRVHLVLSANVFVASLRALALALASARSVVVRRSSREHAFVDALVRHLDVQPCGASVTVAQTLDASDGELVHVYGRDQTVAAIAEHVSSGVSLWPHAAGMGVAFVDGAEDDTHEAAELLARDVVAFDQNGCLSPRVVTLLGSESSAASFAQHLQHALARWHVTVPTGASARHNLASLARYRQTLTMTGELVSEGESVIGWSDSFVIPPTGRHVHICWSPDESQLAARVKPYISWITAVGISRPEQHALLAMLPAARVSALGMMQRPRFDGPVDRRVPKPLTRKQVLAMFQRA